MVICSRPECQTTAGCQCNKTFVTVKNLGERSDEYLRGFEAGLCAAPFDRIKKLEDALRYVRATAEADGHDGFVDFCNKALNG